MTVREFLYWRASFALEPFGETRADWRAAMQMAQQYNMNRGKGASEKNPRDFLLEFRSTAEKGQDMQKLEMALMAQYAAWGGRFTSNPN